MNDHNSCILNSVQCLGENCNTTSQCFGNLEGNIECKGGICLCINGHRVDDTTGMCELGNLGLIYIKRFLYTTSLRSKLEVNLN